MAAMVDWMEDEVPELMVVQKLMEQAGSCEEEGKPTWRAEVELDCVAQ